LRPAAHGSISRGDRPQRALSRPWSVATDHGDAQTDTALFYQPLLPDAGIAEAELERDAKSTIRRMLYAASGDASQGSGGAGQAGSTVGMVDRKSGLLAAMTTPPELPGWLN